MLNEEQIPPFLIGLAIGLVLLVIMYIREQIKRGKQGRQIKDLKKHLQQKLEIEADALDHKKKELEKLRKENENLRISLQSLAQKPGRREVINLQVYQKAISIVSEVAQGFAPMWQKALREAEQEVEAIEAGKQPFIKKIIPLNFLGISSGKTDSEEERGDD